MKFPDGTQSSHMVSTGKYSTNFRAEACALLKAATELNSPETAPEKKQSSCPTANLCFKVCKAARIRAN